MTSLSSVKSEQHESIPGANVLPLGKQCSRGCDVEGNASKVLSMGRSRQALVLHHGLGQAKQGSPWGELNILRVSSYS